jgi:cytochrome b involved in lipid metabolism
MKSSTLAGVIVTGIVLVGAGAFFLTKDNSDTSSSTDSSQTPNTTVQTPNNETTLADETPAEEKSQDTTTNSDVAGAPTKAQVALHNTKDDCWTIIDSTVYDITSYIPRHPGGNNILSACGVDATAFFNGDQSGQQGGTNDHSNDNQAKTQLQSLKVGDLAD